MSRTGTARREQFISHRTVQMKRSVFGLAVAALVAASVAWATPGFLFVTTPLVRSTAATRINIKTHPHVLNDILVQSVVGQPGGYSGWHSHPGPGIVAVRSGIVAIYDGDDPTCTPRYVGAGEVFTEEPGHVHFVRNEGAVAYEAYATFVLPVGAPSRTDAPDPGHCPF
jgi:quercetin dioxygenase-like cupin family protein